MTALLVKIFVVDIKFLSNGTLEVNVTVTLPVLFV